MAAAALTRHPHIQGNLMVVMVHLVLEDTVALGCNLILLIEFFLIKSSELFSGL